MGRPPLITNAALLDTARRVFSRDGLGASVKDIAAELGISEAAIFKRYPTKSDLVIAAMVPPVPDLSVILAPLEDSEDVRGSLSQVMRNLMDYMRETLPVVLPLISQTDIGLENLMRQSNEPAAFTVTNALAERLETLARAGLVARNSARPAAGLMIATAHSLVLFEIMGLHGGAIPQHGIEAMLDTLWFGLPPEDHTPDKENPS
jgi:AcrR family transcriptional regulator